MKSNRLVMGAVIGFLVGAILGTLAGYWDMQANIDLRTGDNGIASLILSGMVWGICIILGAVINAMIGILRN